MPDGHQSAWSSLGTRCEGEVQRVEDDEDEYTVKDVQTAMASLSPMYRAVFNLYVLDNMTHQEIAVKMGISVGTSKSNLAKARRNLRKILIEKKPGNV